MRLIDITLNNLRRRLGRLVLLIVGLTIGVATVVALVAITNTMQQDVSEKLDEYGANILIVPKSNDLSLSYGGVTIASATYDVNELAMADLDRLQSIKNARNISVVAPKLLGTAQINGRSVLVAGVIFPEELRLKQWWRVSGREPDAVHDALAGNRLAEMLVLKEDGEINIEGQNFRIVGILEENGSQDDDILFIDLATAQHMMDKPEAITLAEVAALCIACPIEEMVAQISEALPHARVTAMRKAVTLRMKTVRQLNRFALAVSIVVIAIGGLVVLTTMLGAVAERRQEIGLFRALGFRRQHVVQVILSEAALVSLVGGVFGWLIGMAAAIVLAPRIAEVTISVAWSPWLALGAISGAVIIGIASSVYPAITAARLDPVTALRAL